MDRVTSLTAIWNASMRCNHAMDFGEGIWEKRNLFCCCVLKKERSATEYVNDRASAYERMCISEYTENINVDMRMQENEYLYAYICKCCQCKWTHSFAVRQAI